MLSMCTKLTKKYFFFFYAQFPGDRGSGLAVSGKTMVSDSGKGFKKIHSAYRQIGNVEFSFQDGSGLVVRCGLMYQWAATRFGIFLFISVIVAHVYLFIAKCFLFSTMLMLNFQINS